MIKRAFTVRFTTPAFLGDDKQQGRWRTPPFKAALRECWRIAYSAASNHAVDVDAMRATEAALFGTAARADDASGRSLVRLRLDHWRRGSLGPDAWKPIREERGSKITHPRSKVLVDPYLYLGYGPLQQRKGRQAGGGDDVPDHRAISPEESAELRVAILNDSERFPGGQSETIVHAFALMHQIGSLGGRSRNGYGSLHVEPGDGEAAPGLPHADRLCRDWRACLALDWPHAVGRDEHGPLVWHTATSSSDWKSALRRLAETRLLVNHSLTLEVGRCSKPSERHLVAYPRGAVKGTPNEVKNWKDANGRDLRLPNSLRLKAVPDPSDPSRLIGQIVHLPCRPDERFRGATSELLETLWTTVHRTLDGDRSLVRAPLSGGGAA